MSLFIHIVKDGENTEQSNQNGQFFNNSNNIDPNMQQPINTNNVNVEPVQPAAPVAPVQPAAPVAPVQPAAPVAPVQPVQVQTNKKQRVQSTFGKCAGSVILSLLVFAIAIYFFFGNQLATLVYDFSGLEDLKVIDLYEQSGIDSLLLKLIFSYCWAAFSYSILSLASCLFAVKDSFRKKFIPQTDIKPYKIITNIFFIVFFALDYWICIMNCASCTKLLSSPGFKFFQSMIEESPYFSIINSLPIICCAIVTVFLIITLVAANKMVNKKNAI